MTAGDPPFSFLQWFSTRGASPLHLGEHMSGDCPTAGVESGALRTQWVEYKDADMRS